MRVKTLGTVPDSVEGVHYEIVSYVNELVQMVNQLSFRLDTADTEISRLTKENHDIRMTLGEINGLVRQKNISQSIQCKNIKLGLTEDIMADNSTLFVSGKDGKLKIKDREGVIHEVQS